MWADNIGFLSQATLETLEMVVISSFFAIVLGLPLGVWLFVLRNAKLLYRPKLHDALSAAVNTIRSVPFIILLVAITPLTRLLVGSAIGTLAAMVPLTLSAIPFLARLVESALNEVPIGLVEAALSMGASTLQIVKNVLIPEAMPTIARGITLMSITLVGYSAMAGVVGGGGLGNVAVMYGYQRFDTRIMIVTVVILIVIVQILQWMGDSLAKRLTHNL